MLIHGDNNLIFDSEDDRCKMIILRLTGDTLPPDKDPHNLDNWIPGKKIAFVSFYDNSTGLVKQYCGLYDEDNQRESIKEIMMTGSKFQKVLNMFGEIDD